MAEESRSLAKRGIWLGIQDSNLGYLIQSQTYYRYTNPHWRPSQDISAGLGRFIVVTQPPPVKPLLASSVSPCLLLKPWLRRPE